MTHEMTEEKYSHETVRKACDLYWVFNRYMPNIAFMDLPKLQMNSWCRVAEAAREPVNDVSAMEDINTVLRDRLWAIMQQCADQLGVDIEVDRY